MLLTLYFRSVLPVSLWSSVLDGNVSIIGLRDGCKIHLTFRPIVYDVCFTCLLKLVTAQDDIFHINLEISR